MIKTCQICGREFKTDKRNQKFCSNRCRGLALRKPAKLKTCLVCGKKFKPKANSAGKYCSNKCAGVGRTKARPVYKHVCIICGKEFETSHPCSKCCSRECRRAANKLPLRTCPVCGGTFTHGAHGGDNCGGYCSDTCRARARSKIKYSKRINDVVKLAKEVGLSYGWYKVQTECFGKSHEQLRQEMGS